MKVIKAVYNDEEMNLACLAHKDVELTEKEYKGLTERGYRFMANGILNRSSWAKTASRHGGHSYTPVNFEIVSTVLGGIRNGQ